ncbi:MAG: hypothetical protein O9346_13635 [Leptospiraceae bacterium]|nr:hypothetical protein [Leptospiraceae bacterium]MCZ8347451.1 hypothetical protein [Leptospiraceae bacterium]
MKSKDLFSLCIVLFALLGDCKFFEKEKDGFGKKWMEGPHIEKLEGEIYFIRDEDSVSEATFRMNNLDPRAIAKMAVVPYAKNLERMFKEKKYEDFYYEISSFIKKPLAIKLGIYIPTVDGNEQSELFNEKHLEKVHDAFMDSFRKGEGYCGTSLFFEKPIKKIEIRAYQAFDPRRNPETKEPIDYNLTYRIDYIYNDDPALNVDSLDRSNALTINLNYDFNKGRSLSEVTRIINHCPIPELQDPIEEE